MSNVKKFLMLNIFTLIIFSSNLFAEQKINNLEQIKKVLKERVEGINKFEVQPSPIKGLYMVVAPPRVLYISEDAKFIVDGDINHVATGENYTAAFRNIARYAAIDAEKDSMISFAPKKDNIKHTISVFTDMDCYYCQKLHDEVKEYNRLGIEVRYLAYPRQGLKSPVYDKTVSVWCSKDQKDALTKAKKGKNIPSKKCDNPVARHYALGNELGVRGTPAIVLENGQVYPGYIPAERLSKALDKAKAKTGK